MSSILDGISPEGPILLHCCCAPCASAILEAMVEAQLAVTVFFSNSNIFPFEEYLTRKDELVRYCERLGVPYVEDVYAHEDWQKEVGCGREDMPERSSRCAQCFRFRLLRAANYAAENGFSALTTTLASSRWKSLEQIDEAGRWAVEQANSSHPGGSEVLWWAMNWRKGGLQARRCALIKELNFYNQQYCGCEYSMRKENTVVMFPPAKINLGLNVLRKREDGFHDIETLFYAVPSLCDRLEVSKSEEFRADVEGANWPMEKDLCVRAFRLMQERYGIGNVTLSLRKHIPVGAGLGGGSADCAFTIKALNSLFGLGLSEEEMMECAGELGSDCAFFIKCAPQWGEGRGDILSPLGRDILKGYEIRVEIPEGESINTAEAYKGITPGAKAPSIKEIICEHGVDEWKELLHNDFEDSVFPDHPAIRELKEDMYERGAVYASMSGSGAAVFGIFKK